MRNANLIRHAGERLVERCKLSPDKLKHLLDNGVAIPVALQKGRRHANPSCNDRSAALKILFGSFAPGGFSIRGLHIYPCNFHESSPSCLQRGRSKGRGLWISKI